MSSCTSGLVPQSGGGHLAFTRLGRGPDVTLIHGALVTREDMLLALGSVLSDRFRVTAYDRPGHGQSTRHGLTGSPWRQAQAIRHANRAQRVERPVLIGHSHGGAVAIAYALQFPDEVAGVVALAPLAFPELRLEHLLFGPRGAWPMGAAVNRAASAAIDPLLLPALWRAMFLPQAIPQRYAAVFPFEEAGAAAQMAAEGEDALLLNTGLALSGMRYAHCPVPMRIFGSDRDLVVNNTLHGRLAAGLLPRGRYESLEGLGHMVQHFAQGAIVGAARDLASGA